MSRYDYSEKLKDPQWQKKRLQVMERAGWKCQSCGDAKETLCVHHLVYSKGEPWDAPDETLECLCETCHENRELFNDFFGRNLMPTKACLWFWDFWFPIFDDKTSFVLDPKDGELETVIHLYELAYEYRFKQKIKIERRLKIPAQQVDHSNGETQRHSTATEPVTTLDEGSSINSTPPTVSSSAPQVQTA